MHSTTSPDTIKPIAVTEILCVLGLAGSLILVVQLPKKRISVQKTVGKGQNRLSFQRKSLYIGEAELLGKPIP